MNQITYASIEKAIAIIDNLDDDGLELISEKYALQQPILIGYAMSAATEYENEVLEGYVIYYFCILMESFNQQGLLLDLLTEEIIDAFEEPYFEMLDSYFDNEDEEVLDGFCDQPNLSSFMAIEVSEEDEDGTCMDDDTSQQLFIVSIAMISLLNRLIKV